MLDQLSLRFVRTGQRQQSTTRRGLRRGRFLACPGLLAAFFLRFGTGAAATSMQKLACLHALRCTACQMQTRAAALKRMNFPPTCTTQKPRQTCPSENHEFFLFFFGYVNHVFLFDVFSLRYIDGAMRTGGRCFFLHTGLNHNCGSDSSCGLDESSCFSTVLLQRRCSCGSCSGERCQCRLRRHPGGDSPPTHGGT